MVMQLPDEHDEDSIRLLSHTLSSTITAATSPSLSPTSSSSPSNHRYQLQQNQDHSSHDHDHVVFLSSSFTSSSSHALLRALLLLCGVISLISVLSFGKDKGSRVTVDVVRMSGSVSMAVCPPASFTNETVKPSQPGSFKSCSPCSSSSSPKSILQYPAAVVPTHTFLISFPRSGNSLLRRLLEHATGHLTGSVYGDKRLYRAGLRGEMDQEHVLLLKHHFLDFVDGRVDLSSVWTNDSASNPTIPRFSRYVIHRYIYVVRDPIDALVSYWHFIHSNEMHEAVNPNVTLQAVTDHILYWIPIWAQHVRTFTSTFLLDKSRCQSCQMTLVKYEEIIEEVMSPGPWMSRLLRFLHYPLHRPCAAVPPRSSSPSSSPFVTYAVKERQSLVTPERILARSESYAWEVLGRMNCSQLDWIEHVAGLEMKAMGYWPEEINKIDNMGRRLCERNRNGASVGQHEEKDMHFDDDSIACSN